ncbi:MAG: hypothetical protein WEG40_05580 [Candidatus Rokuibacteriota bacterium]
MVSPFLICGAFAASKSARAGDVAGAEEHLAIARARFQEMGMTFWLERLELDQVGPAGTGPAAI